MNTMKFAVALAATVFAMPALAQQGPRAEVRVGYDRPVVVVEYRDGTDDFRESAGVDGFAYGGEIGYDMVANQTMFGAYAGIEGSTARECNELYGLDEFCIRSGRNIAVGGRVGYIYTPGSVLYAKGGYSNGRIRATYEDSEGILDSEDEGENLDGFHLGAGFETDIRASSYLKLEYVYTNYSGAELIVDSSRLELGLERHQVLAGFGFRF